MKPYWQFWQSYVVLVEQDAFGEQEIAELLPLDIERKARIQLLDGEHGKTKRSFTSWTCRETGKWKLELNIEQG